MGPGFPVSIQSISAAAENYTKVHGKWSSKGSVDFVP